jgi:nitrate reductase delta subunit
MNTMGQNVAGSARRGPLRVGAFRQDPAHVQSLERVKAWTRECLELSMDDTIVVSEVACGLPGCPPLETIVAFWTDTDKRHLFKIFKPVAEVLLDDLPPAWLRDSLYATDGTDFACC